MVLVMATLQPNDLSLTAAKRTYSSQKETQTVQAESNLNSRITDPELE